MSNETNVSSKGPSFFLAFLSFFLQNFVQLRNPQNLSPQHQLVLCLEIFFVNMLEQFLAEE